MANAQALAGKWTYRSFLNDPVQVTDAPDEITVAKKLLGLLFAEAVFTFQIPDDTTLKGAIDWDGGACQVTNVAAANNALTREYRKGWEL